MSAANPQQRLVSIVDDDESVRDAVRRLLRSVGYAAETFASAESFLGSRHLARTACLVLDVRMPGTGGLELQRRLAVADLAIPIVFITAHDDELARRRAMDAGAVAFLRKPFQEESLLAAIRSALEADGDEDGTPEP